DAEVGANRAHHPAISIRLFDDAAGDRAGGLANRASERAEAAIGIDHGNGFRGLLAGPGHHLGPHLERDYS
ncbi:MAG TPA: hypothetical protein VGX46_10480, partial [Vicinamibacterales bacterium]|nr:hypothetical protein [Vicinamibacterales bacterium]